MQDSNGKENSNADNKGQKKNYRRRYHNNRNRYNNKNKNQETKDKEIIDKIVGETNVVAPAASGQGQMSRQNPVLRQNKGQKEINLLINTAVQEILINNADIPETLNDVGAKWKKLSE